MQVSFCLWQKGRGMEIILPKTDFCAKELFANEIIRKYFISDVIGIPLKDIRSIRLCNPYLWKRYRKQKQGILDVLIELNNRAKVNIELQIKFYSCWDKRNLFYLAKMYTEDLRVGQDYTKLKKSISISILDFNYTEDPVYHSVYYLRDERGRMFSDLFEVHIIELRKTLDGDSSVDDWIRFFNAQTEEDLDMLQTKNIGIQTAIEEVRRMSMSERMRARYEAHMKELRDRKAIEAYEREQGYAQGIEQGIEVFVLDNLEENIPKERIIEKLQNRFEMSQTKAESYVERYMDGGRK